MDADGNSGAGRGGADVVAVVIPAYRAAGSVGAVVTAFRAVADLVVVVDDGSDDATAAAAEAAGGANEGGGGPPVVVLRHPANRGVGAATRTAIREALARGADIVVKADADGQMDAADLPDLVAPLRARAADCAKGNRWYHGRALEAMPLVRRFGNLALGFLARAATGAWRVADPVNGYVAWRAEALDLIDLDRAEDRYRFEISMLGLLTAAGGVVVDVPLPARYGGETSHLRPLREAPGFAWFLVRALYSRVWRQYFLHDISAVSLFLVAGKLLSVFGVVFGAIEWRRSIVTGIPATAGTVLLAALPTLLGFNLLLQAAVLDIGRTPGVPLSRHRTKRRR